MKVIIAADHVGEFRSFFGKTKNLGKKKMDHKRHIGAKRRPRIACSEAIPRTSERPNEGTRRRG